MAECRKVWEAHAEGRQQEDSGPSEKYNYVDPEKLIALESTSEQGWYKVVHREGEGGGRDDPVSEQGSDYFNVDGVGEGPNIVTQLSTPQTSSVGTNRVSIIELNRPAATSTASTQSTANQLKDYANMKDQGTYPQEDYVNNPLELLNVQDTPDAGQLDYINSDIVDQSLNIDDPPSGITSTKATPTGATPSSDPIYCEPPDARDYINTDDLDLSSSFDGMFACCCFSHPDVNTVGLHSASAPLDLYPSMH